MITNETATHCSVNLESTLSNVTVIYYFLLFFNVTCQCGFLNAYIASRTVS